MTLYINKRGKGTSDLSPWQSGTLQLVILFLCNIVSGDLFAVAPDTKTSELGKIWREEVWR